MTDVSVERLEDGVAVIITLEHASLRFLAEPADVRSIAQKLLEMVPDAIAASDARDSPSIRKFF